jgi:sec-independent protein translocase protein TatA
MFSQIGPMEIILVLVIALLVLGPKRLPEAGRSLGKGVREFKESVTGAAKDAQVTDLPPTTRNAYRFRGRIDGRTLEPGRYRLLVSALRDGQRSAAVPITFTIAR